MKYKIAIIVYVLFVSKILFAACPAPQGDIYTPLTASEVDVEECIDAADAASGGIVIIPAGIVTWSKGISKTITKNLSIIGSGPTATIITGGSSNIILSLSANAGVTLKVTNMKLISGPYSRSNGMMNIAGLGEKIVFKIYFDNTGMTTGRALWFHGNGVVSNCIFYMPDHAQAISLRSGQPAGVTNYWYGTPGFGTANACYIEDSTFNFPNSQGDGAFDAYSGAKVVFRYNTVIGTSVGWHGNDSSTGIHSAEIYNNTFTDPNNQSSFSMQIRGGTALIWGNTFDSNYPSSFSLSHYRSCQAAGIDKQRCDNTGGLGASRDGNTDATGWPCYQQIGVTGDNGITPWPVIEWNNSHGAGSGNMEFFYNFNFIMPLCNTQYGSPIYDMADHVIEGRDYIDHDTCSGVTSSFCDKWWDDVNKKAKNYNPYEYPHPLTKPLPPRNLRPLN